MTVLDIRLNILLIDYGKESSIKSYLKKFKYFNINHIKNFTKLKSIYQSKLYDICIVDIDDKKERDFVVNFMLEMDKKQKILQVLERKKDCLFDGDCSKCKKFNIKTIFKSSKSRMHNAIYKFDFFRCGFKQLKPIF